MYFQVLLLGTRSVEIKALGTALEVVEVVEVVEARGGGYSHKLPIRVCAAQRGHDFEAPDLERGIHFRGVF